MSRSKLFIQNFLVYGLGGIFSKLIPFVMLLIITRILPNTSYYGINDITNMLTNFATAIAIMGMYDALFRMFFEKEDKQYKIDICSSALFFVVVVSVVVLLFMIVFRYQLSGLFFSTSMYTNLIIISAITTLVNAINTIISAPTRMNNERVKYLLISILLPIISYSISIPLIFKGHYITALPISALIAAILIAGVYWILNKRWFKIKSINFNYIKKMLVIALPLMPNFIIYWVFNSCDKLMIANLLGTHAEGVYAVGSNIGHISQLVYTAFAGGCQYFSFSTMNDKDQVQLTSKIFEYLAIVSLVATMGIMVFREVIFDILFTDEYSAGATVVPYLFLAPLLLMLFQIATNQFLIIKKTWPNIIILGLGAIVNIVLNGILIPTIGIEGAAIATLCGYILSVIIGVVTLSKMKLMKLSKKFIVCCILFGIYAFMWRLVIGKNILISILIAIIIIAVYMFGYRRDIQKLLSRLFKKVNI